MKYNIWIEGYCCMEQSGIAQLEASNIEGKTFIDAVENWYNSLSKEEKIRHGELEIDRENNKASIWGCRFFDNKADARKSFG